MKTVRCIIFCTIAVIFLSLSCFAENIGKISFATTDGNETVGVWTHTYDVLPPKVEYVLSRKEEETVFIKGYLAESDKDNYHKDYYFEYVLPEEEVFDISLLSSFSIETKDVYLASYDETEMLFRFYLDGTENYCEIPSKAGYNETHVFNKCTSCTGNVTKIRFWPVYEVYDKNGSAVICPEMSKSISGVLQTYNEMNVYFVFDAIAASDNVSLPLSSVSGSKYYSGTGIVDGIPKYKVVLAKERCPSPQIEFTKEGESYRPSIVNSIDGVTYSYSVDGGDYVDATNNILPTVSASSVISVKGNGNENYSESLPTIATPFVNASHISMMLDGSINFKLYLITSLTEDEFEVSVDQSPSQIYSDENGKYVICSVAPKDFTDKDFLVQFTADGYEFERTFNAVESADLFVNYSNELALMISALKEYALTAREYFFGIASGVDADETFDEEVLSYDVASVSYNGVEDIKIYSSSLILSDKITIRHYFKVNDNFSLDSYTATCNLDELTLNEKSGFYYVDLENICVSEICNGFTVQVSQKGSENSLSVTYSVASYISRCILESDNDALLNLMRSLYVYYKACIGYINS